jgi:hypothetical protein
MNKNRRERAWRVSLASGVGRRGPRERASWGVPGGEAPRVRLEVLTCRGVYEQQEAETEGGGQA